MKGVFFDRCSSGVFFRDLDDGLIKSKKFWQSPASKFFAYHKVREQIFMGKFR